MKILSNKELEINLQSYQGKNVTIETSGLIHTKLSLTDVSIQINQDRLSFTDTQNVFFSIMIHQIIKSFILPNGGLQIDLDQLQSIYIQEQKGHN